VSAGFSPGFSAFAVVVVAGFSAGCSTFCAGVSSEPITVEDGSPCCCG